MTDAVDLGIPFETVVKKVAVFKFSIALIMQQRIHLFVEKIRIAAQILMAIEFCGRIVSVFKTVFQIVPDRILIVL